MVERRGLQSFVTVPGRIPYSDAARYLSLGMVAVSPKLSATEANGKLLNYMACGLATVASDTPVNRELLGDAGVYVPVNDAPALAQALSGLLTDDDRRARLGQALRQRAEAEFSWPALADRLIGIYERGDETGFRRQPGFLNTMQRDLDRLSRDEFDLLIVGGGISGACLVHDAALRGLSVALIEKRDFGGATSSASSKLLHGGIRYLQQARIDKVRESAMERAAFQSIAPHLSRYVPFLIPAYPGLARGRATLATGVAIYEWLTSGPNARIPDQRQEGPPCEPGPGRHVASSG